MTSRSDMHVACDEENDNSLSGRWNRMKITALYEIHEDTLFNVVYPVKSEGPWYSEVG